MDIKNRLAVTLFITLAAIFFLIPTTNMNLPDWWSQYRINRGLDLQGGMHLVLGIELDEAVKGSLERLTDEVRDLLAEKHIRLKILN